MSIRETSRVRPSLFGAAGWPYPDEHGRYGPYGGRYVPEALYPALVELEEAFSEAVEDPAFRQELQALLETYAGRPTPIYRTQRLSSSGAQLWLKREDLLHTGAHKINNALGQGLLAKRMGKKRLVAETGAGQHGVATATVAALLGMECVVYMGSVDMRRQEPNVRRMRLLGAEVRPVETGSATLKEAVSEAIRDWLSNLGSTHYLLGSALGPHPYPWIVREFQAVIGREARAQFLQRVGALPTAVVACVGGGSNAIGLFHAFLSDAVELVGVEAGGRGVKTGKHAARFSDPERGRVGVLHGCYSYVLQDQDGQIMNTHSVSAGLDYPAVGPEHAYLREIGRAQYTYVTDEEAIAALKELARLEGIICALESAHAVAAALRLAASMGRDEHVLVGLSGRGDKDLEALSAAAEGNDGGGKGATGSAAKCVLR